MVDVEDEDQNIIGVDRVRLPINSRMMEIFQGSDLNKVVNDMLAHMKMQIENPALANSRFRFNEVLFLDVNFHQLNLTQGSPYLPLPDWIANKRAVIILRMWIMNVLDWLLLQHYIIWILSQIPNTFQNSKNTLIITIGLYLSKKSANSKRVMMFLFTY